MKAFLMLENQVSLYQPGHAHADTFNIVLKIKGQDFLVDVPGISTYEPGKRRIEERSTASHNTVTLENLEILPKFGGLSGWEEKRV